MAIDKTQIKPILDGQLGSEVAANMKKNFDMLADGVNDNDSKLKNTATKEELKPLASQKDLEIAKENIKNLDSRVASIENRVSDIVGYYGVERPRKSGGSELSTDPAFPTVIGRADLQQSHPILADYKNCKVKDGEVIGVLDQTNWLEMEDGSPSHVIIDGKTSIDDGSDILFCNTTGFYAILGGDNPDYEIHAVGYKPFSHRGVVAQWISPYGDCPDYSVIKEGIQRSIRDNTTPGSNNGGTLGIAAYKENGYPTTSVSRFNYELYARKKNTKDHSDNKQNVPYAGAFHFDRLVWASLLFIKFKTKDLHAKSVLGGAISVNDGTVSEETWMTKSGMRVRESAEAAWTYQGFSWDRWSAICGNKPMLKMFDPQLALSYARANKVAEKTPFTYDGVTYQYENVKGQRGIYEGEMTAIVTKILKSADTNTEVCLVQPVVCGKIAGWGNVYTWTSGIECVANGESTYDIYQTNDINKMMTDTASAEINDGEKFDFESVYEKLGSITLSSGYSIENFSNSLMCKTYGASLHIGECQYNYYSGKATIGKRGRRGVLFGLHAFYALCALRSAYACTSPSVAASYVGGGFRVTFPETKGKSEAETVSSADHITA